MQLTNVQRLFYEKLDSLRSTLGAGESHLGEISGNAGLVPFTLTLDTNIYASGDVLSDTAPIVNAFRVTDGLAVLDSVTLNDKNDQGVALDLIFLNANVSLGTFNVAPNITAVNADNILGIVSVYASDWIDLGVCRIATIPAARCGVRLKAVTGTTTIYLATITRGGTPTYTVNGITGKLGLADRT